MKHQHKRADPDTDPEGKNGDFSTARVPAAQTVHGLHVALVLIGIAITIPAFLTGAEIGQSMGLDQAAMAIPAGAALLCLIGCMAATIAARTRLTTYMIIQFPFGTRGALVVNAVISITIFGWFTVTASFFGESIQQFMQDTWGTSGNLNALIAFGSALVILTTVFGFKALDKLAVVAVPLLFGALVWLVWLVLQDASLTTLRQFAGSGMSFGQGVTAVVGGFIVGAVIVPDYCRYVRNTAHGLLAAVLHFGIAYPLILFALAVVSIHSGERNFNTIMSGMGLGVIGLLVLIFATWTTNTGNLYSNALVLRTLFSRIPMWLMVVLAGVLGTLLAVAGVTRYFIDFLLFLGICIPPVAGIYIADYFWVNRSRYAVENLAGLPRFGWPAFSAWLLASVMAYGAQSAWFSLTTIPSFDSVLLAFGFYLLFSRVARTR